jgi:hypothetical protein
MDSESLQFAIKNLLVFCSVRAVIFNDFVFVSIDLTLLKLKQSVHHGYGQRGQAEGLLRLVRLTTST